MTLAAMMAAAVLAVAVLAALNARLAACVNCLMSFFSSPGDTDVSALSRTIAALCGQSMTCRARADVIMVAGRAQLENSFPARSIGHLWLPET